MRYRFSPSPTGCLHIGSARTAIFNYLLAKNQRAEFVLRIEDTDAERSKAEYTDNIKKGLEWLGIEWSDEITQSHRIHRYNDYANQLLEKGLAYIEDDCYKLRVPKEKMVLNDTVRGKIERNTEFDNIIIIKSDGMPTFLFANVVDDYLQGITHVVRGQDHINNTFPQLQIYNAFGWKPPEFAHISLILAQDKSKLSKRNGSKSIQQLKDDGYLPESVFNYIALLGWSHPEGKEILSKDEIIPHYSIERVKKSNTCYDENKLKWIQRKWRNKITNLSD